MRRLLPATFVALLLLAAPAFAGDTKAEAEAMGERATVVESEAGHHHAPSFSDINWFYGWLGEREGVTPSVVFRPNGMPAPFGIWLLDAAVLYGFIFRIAKKPLKKALKDRKANILRGMEEIVVDAAFHPDAPTQVYSPRTVHAGTSAPS